MFAWRKRFLVSCCNVDGALYLLEQRGGRVKSRKVLEGGSTGIGLALSRNRIYVAHPSGVRVLDANLNEIASEAFEIPGADAHDVKWNDRELVVVETSHNRVAAYALEKSAVERWSWCAMPGTGDLNHVNSTMVRNGRWLVTMFCPEGHGAPWRDRLDGALVIIPEDRKLAGTILRRGFQQPHSLFESGDALWLCESRAKRVLRLNGPTAEPEVVAELPAYARGLSVNEDWIVVGQSRSDAHFVRPLLPLNQPVIGERGMCGAWFISRRDSSRFFVELPSLEVYDVVQLLD